MAVETPIPAIVIDDTTIKRRGVCEFVEETSLLRLYAQAGSASETLQLVERISELYNFFAIYGSPSDPGRRVLLALAYEAYAGLRPA
jgi:hypothetical protein